MIINVMLNAFFKRSFFFIFFVFLLEFLCSKWIFYRSFYFFQGIEIQMLIISIYDFQNSFTHGKVLSIIDEIR
jgi:hypothetical protein